MYERCISCWMSTGSIRSPPPVAGGEPGTGGTGGSRVSVTKTFFFYGGSEARSGTGTSDVQEPHVLGVAGDERPARVDVFAHEDREQLVRGGGVVQRDLQEHPVRRVHRGLPQLLGVHLAEALVALDALFLGQLLARGAAGLDEAVALAVRVGELRLRTPATPLDLVQRRLGEEHVAGLDQRAHEAEQQRQ